MSSTENHYIETDLGNVSPNPCGEYDPSAQYEYLDLVSYQGGSYLCTVELGTTVTGTAPEVRKNTDYWQLVTLPGNLTPEYIAMHDNVVNKAKQVEDSRAAVEQSQGEIEASQADVQQLHSDTVEAAQKASDSRDSAAGYAQAAETSRQATAESEQNVNAQITGFDTHVSESVTQAQKEIAATRQQAIRAVASQQVTSTQAVKDQTASYITEKEASAKTEIGNYTSEKVAEINNKASEANITLANTIADGTSLKTQLEKTISTADTSKKNLDASDTAAGKTKTALDISNTTATKTKADLDASNTTASEAKTELDATNKTAADLVVSLRDKITEGTRVKTDIQTTGETAMSNLQAEATKQQEYIKTSIDDTLSISGKAADAAVAGKKIDSLKEDITELRNYLAERVVDGDGKKEVVYDRNRNCYYMTDEKSGLPDYQKIFALAKILLGSKGLSVIEMNQVVEYMLSFCSDESKRKEIKKYLANEVINYQGPNHGKDLLNMLWKIAQAAEYERKVKVLYQRLEEHKKVERILKPLGVLFSEYYFYMLAIIDGVPSEYSKTSTPNTTKSTITLTDKIEAQFPVIQKGSKGIAVSMLQAMLGVKVDGDFGNDTDTSLKAFQKNVKLTADGICGTDTWKKVVEHMKANTK